MDYHRRGFAPIVQRRGHSLTDTHASLFYTLLHTRLKNTYLHVNKRRQISIWIKQLVFHFVCDNGRPCLNTASFWAWSYSHTHTHLPSLYCTVLLFTLQRVNCRKVWLDTSTLGGLACWSVSVCKSCVRRWPPIHKQLHYPQNQYCDQWSYLLFFTHFHPVIHPSALIICTLCFLSLFVSPWTFGALNIIKLLFPPLKHPRCSFHILKFTLSEPATCK